MFLDFDAYNKILDVLQSGRLFGDFPEQLPDEYATALAEMQDVIASPYCNALCSIFGHLSNCIDDGHDEAAMKRCFPGFIADCIAVAGEVQMDGYPTLDKIIAKRSSSFDVYTLLLLQYAKFGRYKVGAGTPEEEAYLEKIQEIEPIIDAALLEDDYTLRWNYLNQIMLFMWPSIRERFPKDPQNQQSSSSAQGSPGSGAGGSGSGNGNGGQSSQGGGSGSSGGQQQSQGQQENDGESGEDGSSGNNTAPPTPEEVESALESLMQQIQQSLRIAPAPVNCSGEAVTPNQINSAPTPSSGTDGLSQIVQSLSEEKAAGQIQKELDAAQMEAIRNTNLPLVHKHVPVRVIRHNKPDEVKYREISEEIAPVVRNLTKQMLDLFREFNEERVQHHKRYGPMVEATEAYRPDRAFFAKKKLPEDLPDMALCVLIDQSGSMWGHKLETAIKTVILLEQFANAVGIPLLVAGHDVDYQVNLRIFTDFVSAMSEKDKYSLAGIESGGCNRDGLPIRLCCDLLEQRTEKVRLMVVISDGSPYDDNYSGEEARKDISDTVNQFRRKGLTIYGAAIDDDRDIIQSIYGKDFLSIDNLDLLPKTLVRLVRQHII